MLWGQATEIFLSLLIDFIGMLWFISARRRYSILNSSSREIPPAISLRRINKYCMATFPWVPWPFPPDSFYNRWFPPFISDDTPRTRLLASACFDLRGTRRTGRRNREEDGESEKATERKKKRRKREGKEGRIPAPTDVDSSTTNGGVGPDSKLEKICSESSDWDPGEIVLQLPLHLPLSSPSLLMMHPRNAERDFISLDPSPADLSFRFNSRAFLWTIEPRDLSIYQWSDHFGSCPLEPVYDDCEKLNRLLPVQASLGGDFVLNAAVANNLLSTFRIPS